MCGTDGKTYGSECELATVACFERNGVRMRHIGPCEDGGDGDKAASRGDVEVSQYPAPSSFHRFFVKILKGDFKILKLSLSYLLFRFKESSCAKSCPNNLKEVCGTDGVTYR